MFSVIPQDTSSAEEKTMLRSIRSPGLNTRARHRVEMPLQPAPKLNSQTLREMPRSLHQSINATKVEYRKLGNSGLRISNPILGCMHFGSSKWFDWVLDETESIAVLKEAYDRGINTVSLYSAYAEIPKVWLTRKIVGHCKRLL